MSSDKLTHCTVPHRVSKTSGRRRRKRGFAAATASATTNGDSPAKVAATTERVAIVATPSGGTQSVSVQDSQALSARFQALAKSIGIADLQPLPDVSKLEDLTEEQKVGLPAEVQVQVEKAEGRGAVRAAHLVIRDAVQRCGMRGSERDRTRRKGAKRGFGAVWRFAA